MDAAERVTAYLDELAQQRRRSPHTVSNYRREHKLLCNLCGESPRECDPLALDTHHIRRFVSQLHLRGLSGRSLARTLSAWRGFYRWLGLRGEIVANPVESVRPPNSP